MRPAPLSIARVATVTLLVIACACAATLLSACGTTGAARGGGAAGSVPATVAALFPGDKPAQAEWPPPAMTRAPQTAVYSYALWISSAYRLLNSKVASQTFTPDQEVFVDSYVEYNREQGRAIDQRITGWKVKSLRSEGSSATVAVREDWAYRYIDIGTGRYSSPPYTVSYDSTYTVVKDPSKGWLVESVEATSVTGPVK